MVKIIMHIEPEDYILAARTFHYLYKDPERRDIAMEYENTPGRVFTARRNKNSITVWERRTNG